MALKSRKEKRFTLAKNHLSNPQRLRSPLAKLHC